MIGKNCFRKNKNHIGVVHVPSFHLFARSSSFFHAFFVHFYGKPFYGSPDNKTLSLKEDSMNCQSFPQPSSFNKVLCTAYRSDNGESNPQRRDPHRIPFSFHRSIWRKKIKQCSSTQALLVGSEPIL